MQDSGDMRTELEKKVALEERQFEENHPTEVAKQKDKIKDVIKLGEQEWKSQQKGLVVTKETIVNGIIWSEILQPPRAKNKFKNNLMRK